MRKDHENFDVAVVGGGPAGMMAAGRAAELGARVVLVEKNKNLGRKLSITGKGRCNITQAGCDKQEFIEKIGKKGRFLHSSLAKFDAKKIINFFERRGVRTKIERGGRVFPTSDDSRDVIGALFRYLKNGGVTMMFGEEVLGFSEKKGKIESIRLKEKEVFASHFIICTGGKSYPTTGSTGDGYDWARRLGHTVISPSPALVPVNTEESWVGDLQGASLRNVQIGIIQNGKKKGSHFGEMIFTHFGVSGPIILNASKDIGELLKEGKVTIEIDLKPALDFSKLDKRLQRDFSEKLNKDFKNYLPNILPKKLIGTFINLSGISPEKKLNSITKEERRGIVRLLKGMRVSVSGLGGYDQAIITTGGVDLREVDSKTMQSRVVKNLSFAGEVLDLDGPTGGYNLQICWSTGYAAGTSSFSGK